MLRLLNESEQVHNQHTKHHLDRTCFGKQFWFPLTSMYGQKYNGSQWKLNGFGCQHSSKYHLLCSTEEKWGNRCWWGVVEEAFKTRLLIYTVISTC